MDLTLRAFLNIRRGRKPYSHRPQPAIISLALFSLMSSADFFIIVEDALDICLYQIIIMHSIYFYLKDIILYALKMSTQFAAMKFQAVISRVYHYEGVGKTDTGQDVLLGQTGIIIFYNFIWCNSIAQKFQNQMNRDSSALDNRFSKTYFRIDDDPIRYFNQSRSPQPKVYRLLGDLIIPFTFRQLYYNSKI